MSLQISAYISDFENEVERMKLLQYGALEDADLNKLAILSEDEHIEQMERIDALWNRLYAIHNSSPYIRNVNAHIYPIAKRSPRQAEQSGLILNGTTRFSRSPGKRCAKSLKCRSAAAHALKPEQRESPAIVCDRN